MDPNEFAKINFDAESLYREETFTDLKVGSIQKLTPIKTDGSDDDSRKVTFVIRTQIMSPAGAIPIHAPVEAKSLEEVIEQFPAAVQAAVEKMVAEAEAMQREQASRIVVPGQSAAGDIKLV